MPGVITMVLRFEGDDLELEVPLADEVILTRAAVERAADPEVIRGYIKGKRTYSAVDVKEALGAAFGRAGENDMILATGSFFLIGEVRKMIL